MKKVCFRVDGNSIVGLGHIMRCLSLAKALQGQEIDCTFITADNAGYEIIKTLGFETDCLQTPYDKMELELPAVLRILRQRNPLFVVVDSYFVSHRYMSALRCSCATVYIDDLAKTAYPVNTLVNYNIYSSKAQYEKLYQDSGEQLPFLLLGPGYAPLRAEFQKVLLKEVTTKAQNIFISTGGSDSQNLTMKILLRLQKSFFWKEARFHVVVGRMNPYREALKRFSQQNSQVVLHWDVQAMSALMCSCDLAVSAAGSTLYELCACGVPTVTYTLADNQLPGAKAFHNRGLIYNAGDCREDIHNVLNRLIRRLEELWSDRELRAELSQKQKAIVDGKGAGRLARILKTNMQ